MKSLGKHALKFLSIGSSGYAVDIILFNVFLLLEMVWLDTRSPIAAKAFSATIAIMFTYLGNSRWTFKERFDQSHERRYLRRFVAIQIVAIVFTLAPLAISRYYFGLDSWIADNFSANVIGALLAALFRFVSYREWVFSSGGPR